jgi:type IV secretory pathway TrbD component
MRESVFGDPAMSERPSYRPVYKAIHRPLTICGIDRRLFFMALLLGAATFNLFYSFLAGLLMFAGLYGFALWAAGRDPDMLRILLASSNARRRYDPGKHEPFDAEVRSC